MCTLILAHRFFSEAPLFLASNRDERLDRPAREPMLWSDRKPGFVAPRDEEAGGTWLGVNEHGLLVAITNRFGQRADPDLRSRGALVVDALGCRTAADAAAAASSFAPGTHNPFHLVVADADEAFVVWADEQATTRFPLAAGIHVVTERSFGAAPNGRADFLERCVDELRQGEALTPSALERLLGVHRPDDLDAVTVLVSEMNYGTRSSTIIDVEQRRLAFADGPPNESAYVDYSDLLQELWR